MWEPRGLETNEVLAVSGGNHGRTGLEGATVTQGWAFRKGAVGQMGSLLQFWLRGVGRRMK